MGQKNLAAAGTDSSPQPFIVLGEDPLVAKALRETLQQHRMRLAMRGRQAVVHPQAVFPGNHQPGPAQIGEVPGGGGLRNVQDVNEVADAQFAALQQIEDPQPGAVGKRRKIVVV